MRQVPDQALRAAGGHLRPRIGLSCGLAKSGSTSHIHGSDNR
jgi:hypothetical protein